jgi:hypothetical protein
MSLIKVADGAYPHPPYDFLPADVLVWAGYVGGHTPHAWSPAEIADVRAAGLTWWGIWTAATGRALGVADGRADAAGMIARLADLGYPRRDPVLYDVESSSYRANPTGALAAVAAWKQGMHAAGYDTAVAYLPVEAGFDWLAHWTGVAPVALTLPVLGVQYDHALHSDAYDLSVFQASLLRGPDMPLTPADIDTWLDHQVVNPANGVVMTVRQRLLDTEIRAGEIDDALTQIKGARADLAAVADEAAQILAAVKALPAGGGLTLAQIAAGLTITPT